MHQQKLKTMFELELTRFNLYVLANGMDYLTLVKLKNDLIDVKNDMEKSRATLVELTFEFGQNVEAVAAINTQLEVVEHNLKVVGQAILMKEAEPFEYWQELEPLNLQVICLN